MNRAHRTLKLLAAERPPQLDMVDEARRQRDLASILETSPSGRGPGARRRRGSDREAVRLLPRRRRSALRAGLAVALVAAVVATVTMGSHMRSDRAGDQEVQAGKAPGRSATTGDQADPQTHAFLLASAKRVLEDPAPPEGPYWYTRTRNLVVTGADAFSRNPRGLRFQVRIESTSERWIPKHRGTGHSVEPTDLPSIKISFPTAKDEAAWRAAGSPRIDYPPAGVGRVQDESDTVLRIWLVNGKALSADELLRLPTDAVQLEARIRALLQDAGVGLPVVKTSDRRSKLRIVRKPGQVARATDKDVFDLIMGWLTDAPLTPRLQAALYEVLAGLSGVRVEGSTTDIAGRSGIAIAWGTPADTGDGGALVKNQFIIQSDTGQLLGIQQVIVRPARPSGRVDPTYLEPAGTAISARAYVARHWTEGPGPDGWPTNPPGVPAPKG